MSFLRKDINIKVPIAKYKVIDILRLNISDKIETFDGHIGEDSFILTPRSKRLFSLPISIIEGQIDEYVDTIRINAVLRMSSSYLLINIIIIIGISYLYFKYKLTGTLIVGLLFTLTSLIAYMISKRDIQRLFFEMFDKHTNDISEVK